MIKHVGVPLHASVDFIVHFGCCSKYYEIIACQEYITCALTCVLTQPNPMHSDYAILPIHIAFRDIHI